MVGCWENACNYLDGMRPTLMMVCVQAIFAIANIAGKLATNDGMRLPVFVAYRFMFGASFIVPIAIFVERKKRPKLTWKTLLYGFLCGLFGGSLGQNLYLGSLTLTSPTFISAMINLTPAITFVIAILFRLEKLNWNTSAGKAKVLGTLIGIGGAMLITFYKGPELNLWNTNINLLETTTTHHHPPESHQGGSKYVLGALLALASCVSYSLYYILQAKAGEKYPCPYSITAMMTGWGLIQSVVYAVCTENDWSNWVLGWNIRLLTVVVSGVLGSGVIFVLIAWCVKMRGPVFVSIFGPLLLVMVAIADSLLLEEQLHLGMVLGAILIISGLYIVQWGKGKELKRASQTTPEIDDPSKSENIREDEKRNSQGSSDV